MTTVRSKRARIVKRHALALALAVIVVTATGFADGLGFRQPGGARPVEPDVATQVYLHLGARGMADFFPPR